MSTCMDNVQRFPMVLEGSEGPDYFVEERGKSRVAVHRFSDVELDLMGNRGVRIRRAVDAVNQGNSDPVEWPRRPWDRFLADEKRVAPRGSAQLGLEKI